MIAGGRDFEEGENSGGLHAIRAIRLDSFFARKREEKQTRELKKLKPLGGAHGVEVVGGGVKEQSSWVGTTVGEE